MSDMFSEYHPAVNFLFFMLTLAFSMFLLHPVCLAVSLCFSLAYALTLNGGKALRAAIRWAAPMLILTVLINAAFNHEGATILTYLPDGSPLTLESILYGAAAGCMLITVLLWFSCYNAVMTSDKFVYLFGRAIPSLALVLSMTLRLVPRFRAQIKDVAQAQRGIGRDASSGGLPQRIRHGMRILSIVITWVLENALETADSMKSRGYGLPGRTAFSLFRFERRDLAALLFLGACGVYLLAGVFTGGLAFAYFPVVLGAWTQGYTISLFAVYLALCATPLAINIREERRWKAIGLNI